MGEYLKPYQDAETKQWFIYVDTNNINRGITRHQLMQAALNLGMNTNSLVRELNLLEIHHLSGNTYFYSRTASEKQKDILRSFGLSERSLELLALRENVQVHRKKIQSANFQRTNPKK